MKGPYLLPGLERSTKSVRRILALIPNASLDVRREGRLTPREVLAHLADIEGLYRARMEQALLSPGTRVEVIDNDRRGIELGYGQADPDREMIKWEMERGKTLALLQDLAPEDWSKSVHHPTRGEESISLMAFQALAHDAYHIEQLTEFLLEEPEPSFICVDSPVLETSETPVYSEYIQTRTSSLGIYALPAGSIDGQVPHLQDELYYVLGGKAKFECEGQVVSVRRGSSIFVAAEKAHRFLEIEEDLQVLVVFPTPSS